MRLGAPQFILFAMLAVNMGICMARFGEAKRDKYDLMDLVGGPALTVGLLYWGGFFT